MLTIEAWSFSKRENSTLIPTASGATITVALKGGCDMLNPVLIVNNENLQAFNYFKMQNRYYFVTGITSVRNNLVEISGRCDVLGSWKAAIQSTNAFVAYDASANTEIADKRLSVKRSMSIARDAVSITGYSEAGTIIAYIQGEGSIGAFEIAGGNIYRLTEGVYTQVDQTLNSLPQQVEEFWKFFIKQTASQGQAGDNIKGAYWYPWILSDSSDQNMTIFLGSFQTNFGGTKINKFTKWIETVVEIPWQADDWRRSSPYTEVYLYMPFIGVINIPTSQIMDEEFLTVQYGVNRLNGNVSACVIVGNNNVLYTGSGSSGMPIPVGAANVNTGAIAGGVIGAAAALIGGAAAGGAAAAAGITAGLGSIMGAGLDAILPVFSSTLGGGGGAANELYSKVTCWTVFHDTNVTPTSVASIMGTPTMATKSLSGVSGYVQTIGASVSGSMTDTERSQINSYLDRGIYIE